MPGESLFSHHWFVDVKGFGEFEAYFNRDSIPYIEMYGLEGVVDMFRATLRYPGWSYTMQKLADLRYFDLDELTGPPATYAGLTRLLGKVPADVDVREELAESLQVDAGSDAMCRMEWLGLFAEEAIPWADLPTISPLDALASLMLTRMPLEAGERDLCVMQHEVVGAFPSGERETTVSTLIVYGDPDSAIARTVGLPAAISVDMILDGRISDRGVLMPVSASVYKPILDELAAGGDVVFTERIAAGLQG